MFIQLLRLLKGYVFFSAEGGFPERFINLCNNNNIYLWDVKNDGVKVKACTTTTDFKRINLSAENSGMEIKDANEKGLKSFVIRYKYRLGLCLGAFLAIFVVAFLSGYIWEVEIVSNGGVNVEAFTESLAESGVKKGARRSEIDVLKVQEEMMCKHNELLWLSVNIFGSKAQVEISLVSKKQDDVDEKTPSNIVAKKDGLITLVKGYYGVNSVKEGDNVVKGTLLISGVGAYADGSSYFTRAKGEVYAKTENECYEKIRTVFNSEITCESKSFFGIEMFSLKIPFGKADDNTEKTESFTYLKSEKAFLPLAIYRIDATSIKNSEVKLTENQSKLYCLTELIEKKREQYDEAEIYEETYFCEPTDGYISLRQNIKCIENIAKEQTIAVEN